MTINIRKYQRKYHSNYYYYHWLEYSIKVEPSRISGRIGKMDPINLDIHLNMLFSMYEDIFFLKKLIF